MYKQIFNNDNTQKINIEGYEYALLWRDDLGIGYLPTDGYDYGIEYWEKYLVMSAADFGHKLNQLRLDFVKRNNGNFNNLCDVGIGSGQFVETAKCKGTDVNPLAIAWLKEHNYFADDLTTFKELTLWDVIEHIEDPSITFSNATQVFISTPIYQDLTDCLKSKHFRPGEHIWYFTDAGIKNFMALLGYTVRDESDFETVLGRESILSYHFSV